VLLLVAETFAVCDIAAVTINWLWQLSVNFVFWPWIREKMEKRLYIA